MSFTAHKIRPVLSLNKLWEFSFLGTIDINNFSPKFFDPTTKQIVPSAFDTLPSLEGTRGAAAYRTHFTLEQGRRPRINFGAVSIWCRIFVNGVSLGDNVSGYTPFAVDVPPSPDGNYELVVLVDNRFNFERSPMHEEYFDFYQYGGIIREVHVHSLPVDLPLIESVKITPTEDCHNGTINLSVTFGNVQKSQSLAAFLTFDDGPQRIPVKTTGATLQLTLKVPNPSLWSPESPSLHTLNFVLCAEGGTPSDDMIVKFGLRHIAAREGRLWLNGRPIELRGYNRHEWHPNFGPCTPPIQMMNDLLLLKDLGCNFIRGSHYPQDQRFLDLCDEIGFFVWEENLGWGQKKRTFESGKWREDHTRSLKSMVAASFNHPCVIIWGFLNEAASNENYTREVFSETVELLRKLDPSRIISYATNVGDTDKHFDLIDLIALNIYPGWYDCEDAEEPHKLIAPEIRRHLKSIDRRGFADKPVIISEIGAEALYGWRDQHDDFFSEAYQATYLQMAATEALENPRCSGIALWQFTDTRTYGRGRSLIRPRTFNNKGTLDEYRRPKASYQVIRELFRSRQSDEWENMTEIPAALPPSKEEPGALSGNCALVNTAI